MKHAPVYLLILASFWLAAGDPGQAAYRQAELPLEKWPTEHDYQTKLRHFLATLTESDLTVELQPLTPVEISDPEELYRLWLLSKHLPAVKAAAMPAAAFTLRALEAQKGLLLPAEVRHSQILAWLAHWEYPGNPYRGSRALQLRAFVLAAVDLVMLDYLYEHDPQEADRSDYLGGNLIWIGYTFNRVQEALPPSARAAFEAGLKKQVLRLNRWGPKGIMLDMDLFAPVGLRYIHEATQDPELKAVAESYSRRLFTEARYFHPAGYFTDCGCFDTSYNGISLYFGTWVALMSDWSFARRALDRAWRLRAHLSFPDPDGSFSGPSQMSSRTSADPPHDQWQFPPRNLAAGMISEEALYLSRPPSPEELKAALEAVVAAFNQQLAEPVPTEPQPWKESHWSNDLNYAWEHYRKGHYARLCQLQERNSPLLQPLYQREGTFVREFSRTFVVAKFPTWAAAIHTGPVGKAVGHLGRPYGYGGGQLSVFWTPSTGSVMVGRRRGVQGNVFDTCEEWRSWPIHALTGLTGDGELVSSSRIEQPRVRSRVASDHATVRVRGVAPKYNPERTAVAPSSLRYERLFQVEAGGLRVVTTVTSAEGERMAELYETLPVFLREQSEQKPADIRFRVGDDWMEATTEPQSAVRAIRIKRFDGTVNLTFSRPRTVRLSPQVWQDGFQTRAECRTLLVDLIESQTRPALLQSASVEYTISSAAALER